MKLRLSHTAVLLAALAAVSAIAAAACRKSAPQTAAERRDLTWHRFAHEDYDGILYVSWENGTATGVLCGTVAGLNGSVRLSRACTAEQFESLRKRLVEHGADYLGTADEPQLDGYPDLSAYLPLVMSSDEENALWRALGLE